VCDQVVSLASAEDVVTAGCGIHGGFCKANILLLFAEAWWTINHEWK
jgi:hypothetical protein